MPAYAEVTVKTLLSFFVSDEDRLKRVRLRDLPKANESCTRFALLYVPPETDELRSSVEHDIAYRTSAFFGRDKTDK